jgi:Ca2+-binding RTX toxin-like protein
MPAISASPRFPDNSNDNHYSTCAEKTIDMAELNGTDLNDTLAGTSGDDTLSGGNGNDLLRPSSGYDDIDGGAGIDTMEGLGNFSDYSVYRNSTTSVYFSSFQNRTTYWVSNVEYFSFADGMHTLAELVGIAGTARNDVLNGTAGNDTLDGAQGNDTMRGGQGNDEYHVDSSGDVIQEAADGGIDRVYASTDYYKLSANVEGLIYTGTGSFTGIGNAQNNGFSTGEGNDSVEGGAGDDSFSTGYGDDTMIGGEGNDAITASSGDDLFDGGSGIDSVFLMADRDSYMIRRAGTNGLVFTYIGAGAGDGGETLTVYDVENFYMVGVRHTLAEFQAELPPDGSDSIEGTDRNDLLDGHNGVDTLIGGAGDDTYVVRSAKTMVVENDGEGIDTVRIAYAGTAWHLADFVENGVAIAGKLGVAIDGNALDNALTGNDGNNTLAGNAGNDTLDGGKGNDVLAGGSGDDTYYVDAAGDKVTELADGGIDTVVTSLAKYTLGANVENVTYTGTVAFAGTGNALDNVIAGGSGNDTIDGAGGSDTYVITGAFADYARQRPNATDLVLVKGTQKITLKNIEKVQFSDGTKSLAELYANIASAANDTLTGTDGNDHMNGLAGADQLAGGKGNDTYFIDNAGDTVIELAGEGTDTVDIAITAKGTYTLGPHVENATITSTAAINVIGNAEDNTLTGNAAANALTGGDGNDILIGGKGNDTLDGGAGDDFYAVDAAGDKVIETEDGGYDVIETTLAKYTLAANVEELRFTGKGAFTGIGNALDNVIIGGTGNDKLTGGGGADTFVIGTGNDTVTDFARGVDTLVINRTIGNGDNAIDGAVTLSSAGGFSSDAELVIFTQKVASLTVANAAKAIGSATEAYAKGDTALFALHDAKGTALYLFTSSGNDAAVSAGELAQIATLTGVSSIDAGDFAMPALS